MEKTEDDSSLPIQSMQLKVRTEGLDEKIKVAMSLIPSLTSQINDFESSQMLSDDFFTNMAFVLSSLISPEQFHFNAFLFTLAFGGKTPQYEYQAREVLKDSVIQDSFNSTDFENSSIFEAIMTLMGSDDGSVMKFAYCMACSIFEKSDNRSFIPNEMYLRIIEFVSEELDKSGIVASMCIRARELDRDILQQIFPLIVILIQGKPKELPEIGLMILAELLKNQIEIDQGFLSKCIEPFFTRLDSEISSCLMKIMMNLQEAPHSFLPRLLQIVYSDTDDEYYGETEREIKRCCGSSAILLLKKFANQDAWNDEEKKQIIYTLVSLLDKFTYRNIKGALQILIKIMDPLPTDVGFFRKVTEVINERDFTHVGLDAILQILQKCEKHGIDPEMIEVLHDMEPSLEQFQMENNQDIADLSRLVYQYMYVI